MNIAVTKNHAGGQILYITLDPSKKRRQNWQPYTEKNEKKRRHRIFGKKCYVSEMFSKTIFQKCSDISTRFLG